MLELQIEMMMNDPHGFFYLSSSEKRSENFRPEWGFEAYKKKKKTVVDHSPSFQAAVIIYENMTRSVLGAPVNSTCCTKKIVNCTIKQSGKVPHKVL